MTHALRSAVRGLRHRPGLCVLAVLLLALGIGAALSAYALLRGVLLAPLPMQAPERLVNVWETHARHGNGDIEVAYGTFAEWQKRNRSFEAMAILPSVNMDASLGAPDGAMPVQSTWVSEDFFRVLGAAPLAGRSFAPGEEAPGQPATTVISHRLWQSRFGGRADALGQTIEVDGDKLQVIGVMPADFDFPRDIDLWAILPRDPAMLEQFDFRVWRVVARLREGVAADEATREMNSIMAALAKEHPNLDGFGVKLEATLDEIFGDARRALPLLQGATLLVALIACVNAAHLLLARALARRRELAVRQALGADRARLRLERMLEAVLLSLFGGVLGTGLAAVVLVLVRRFAPADLPRLEAVGLDAGALAVALGLSLAFGVLAGAIAAWRSLAETAGDSALREGGRGNSAGRGSLRLRRGLAISEIAMAAVLLAGALVLVRSALALQGIDPGYRTEGLFTARVPLVRARYPDDAKQAAFFERLLHDVRALPEVDAAAAVLLRPLGGTVGWDYPFTIEGQTPDEAKANAYSNFEAISTGYFDTVGLPLLRGRDFSADDRADTPPVVIIGERFAQQFWPGQDALGKRLRIGGPNSDAPWATVVGIAKDGRYRQWEATRHDLYAPFLQRPEYRMDFVVRTKSDPAAFFARFQQAVHAIDRDQAASVPTTMRALVDATLARPRFVGAVLAALSLLAALLAAAGVLAVMLHGVEQRRSEFGVRLALGEAGARLLRRVLGDGIRLALAGAALGSLAALAVLRTLESLVFGVQPIDPLSLALGAGLLLAATTVASLWPAVRAARIAPVDALRGD